jgi:hypothetical protein
MGAALTALAVVGAGCGSVLGADSAGDPLVLLKGELRSNSSALVISRPDQLRAALVWGTFTDETVSCLTSGELECFFGKNPQVGQVVDDVPVSGAFPYAFEIPVFAPPAERALHRWKDGSVLALASVVAYEDRNGNERLDEVGPEDLVSPDSVLGYAGLASPERQVVLDVVYREGNLHPMYAYLYPDCPEVPQGFSVIRQSYESTGVGTYSPGLCEVLSDTVTLEMFLPEDGAGQIACSVSTHPYYQVWRPAPEQVPDPATTSWSCRNLRGAGGYPVLLLNEHPERFCTSANTVVYALYDGRQKTWDQRASPPAWWPCPLP